MTRCKLMKALENEICIKTSWKPKFWALTTCLNDFNSYVANLNKVGHRGGTINCFQAGFSKKTSEHLRDWDEFSMPGKVGNERYF